jgi:hypothetical protein
MSASATLAASSEALSTAISSSVIATLGLACHSPFIRVDKDDRSVDFCLDGSIERKDMQKMAQAMPSLMKAARPLTSEEEIGIGYYKMDAGRKRYVYGPGDGDQRVLSHVFVDESMVISAGAREVIEEMQAVFLHKIGEATGQDVLEFEEKLKSFRLPDNIENRRRAIPFSPTIAQGQHKIAPAKHIELACDNDSNMRAKITKLSTLFAEASQRIF